MAKFLVQLQVMLTENPDHAVWSNDGTYFTITDRAGFAQNVLRKYFKHSNMTSFTRQLNMYDFRKRRQTYISNDHSYWHPFFQKGDYQLMEKIVRRNPGNIVNNEVVYLRNRVGALEEEIVNLQMRVKSMNDKMERHASMFEEVGRCMHIFKSMFPNMSARDNVASNFPNLNVRDGVKGNQPLVNRMQIDKAPVPKCLIPVAPSKKLQDTSRGSKLIPPAYLAGDQPVVDGRQQKNFPKIVLPGSRLQNLSCPSRSLPPAKKSRSSVGDARTFLHRDTNPPGSIISLEDQIKTFLSSPSPTDTIKSELSNETKRKIPKRSAFNSLNPNRKVHKTLNTTPAQTDRFERSKPESSHENNLAAVFLPKRNFISGDVYLHSAGNDKNNIASSSDVYVDGADESDLHQIDVMNIDRFLMRTTR